MLVPSLAVIAAGFALGLAGSVHCAGMCGPIAIALPRETSTGAVSRSISIRQALLRMLYQCGRVTTYTLLGIVIGVGGSIVHLAGFSREISISVGVLMLALAASQLILRRSPTPSATNGMIQSIIGRVQRWMHALFARSGIFAHLGIGLANGLLPCGLVTTALLASLATHSISGSALFMASFGFGTVPLMSAIAIFGLAIPCTWRSRIRMASPVLTAILALLIITRGLGLGIPYLSPGVLSAQNPISCCAR